VIFDRIGAAVDGGATTAIRGVAISACGHDLHSG
jgi:hypothetical protein